MTVLARLVVYYYHGDGSAAFPNYFISIDGPTVSALTYIKKKLLFCFASASKIMIVCTVLFEVM